MSTPPRNPESRRTPSAPTSAPSPAAPLLRLPPRPDPRGARAFAGLAEQFEQGRPPYAGAAVEWLVRRTRAQVVDVGAGTGKLTRAILGQGHTVLAVEPVSEMLDQMREAAPRAHSVRARAEALPVVSRSVDAVLAAESFGWFDASAFLSEATRVLRPGGTLGLLWNEPDVRVPWVRRFAELIGDDHLLADPDESRLPHIAIDDTGQFESVEQRSFRVWHRLRRPELHALVASRPEIAARGPVALERLLAEVDALFDDVSPGSEVAMPLTTHCFRTAVLPWAYVGPARRSGSTAAQTGPSQAEPSEPLQHKVPSEPSEPSEPEERTAEASADEPARESDTPDR